MGGAVLHPEITWVGALPGAPTLRDTSSPFMELGPGLPSKGAVCGTTEGSGSRVCNTQPGRAPWLRISCAGAAGTLGTDLSD